MDRRAFLAGAAALLAAPVAGQAQQAGKVYRIGLLERTSEVVNAANVQGLRQGLRELGYVEGKDFVFEYRSADGRDERFPELAVELVHLPVDVILTRGTPATLAAKRATSTIPVVVTGVGDPVGQGLVASLARPGANVTGLSGMVTEVYPKLVELLKALVPRAARIVALFNMGNPAVPPQWKQVESAARALGLSAQLLDARKAEDLEPAFIAARRQRAEGLVVGIDTVMLANGRRIVELAATHRLPAIYPTSEFVGGLVAYGLNYQDTYRRAARFIDKILKGARPADLPWELATKLELVINLKTAKALGLTIPRSLLLRADQVIE